MKELKLTVQIQLALYSWDLFWANNHNKVEKQCFVVLKIKLGLRLKLKMFYWF